MAKYASKIVAQARSWLGCKESDGSHKKIIDVYNAHKPLARGYKVQYTDAWCATFVSAVSIACGYTDIIPTECGCGQMLELFKKLGCWVENDAHVPSPGDIMFYDWEDSGKGDNTGWPDHVGIVEAITGRTITVIEGNYSNSVKRRYISFDAKLIRGYGAPKYDKENGEVKTEPKQEAERKMVSVSLPVIRYGYQGEDVKAMQSLLILRGHSCGKDGADGKYGPATKSALVGFQTDKDLAPDAVCGQATWAALVGV